MSKSAWWVPVGSFGLACALSLMAGPSSKALARRAPQTTTGCAHIPYTLPQNPTGTTTIIDGVNAGTVPVEKGDFDPTRHFRFANSVTSVSMGQNASLSLTSRLSDFGVGGLTPVTATGKTFAQVGFALTEGTCCHLANIYPEGKVRGRVMIRGALRPFTLAQAIVGQVDSSTSPPTASPCRGTVQAFWDDDCNGVLEGQKHEVQVVATLQSIRDLASMPSRTELRGFIQSQITHFTETGNVVDPPQVQSLFTNESGSFTARLSVPQYGFQTAKHFKEATFATHNVQAGSMCALSASGAAVGHLLPDTAADIAFDLAVLGEKDIDENKVAELFK